MIERDLQTTVIELARLYRWKVAHFRPALTRRGWRTPVEADGKGFPDLLMAREKRLLAVELKVGKKKPTVEQEDWLETLRWVGAEIYVWTEKDLPDGVLAVLK